MSDQGFDFKAPPPRRQPKPFEPPPWEKDQFEQLARERAEQERLQTEAALAAAAPEEESEPSSEEVLSAAGEDVSRREEAHELAEEADQRPEGPRVQLDERQVELMMLGLREEEPPALESMWLVNLAAGAVVGIVGLALGVWGAAAFFNAKLGETGKLGGMVMAVFGVAFIGIGGWLMYRALRQRGVL